MEIKTGQWRGGVWQDPASGVNWLIVAGLAKGEHQDHDDIYQRIERETRQATSGRWLPTAADQRLLKRETAARLLTVWELGLQESVLSLLREVATGGRATLTAKHPLLPDEPMATVRLEVEPVRQDDYRCDEIELVVDAASKYAGSELVWQLTLRALITLSPPEQSWDRYGESFSNIGEPGSWLARAQVVADSVARGELMTSEPGRHSHYTHRKHLAGNMVEGRAVQSLCGAFFVPAQDHQSLPVCPECESRYRGLPK